MVGRRRKPHYCNKTPYRYISATFCPYYPLRVFYLVFKARQRLVDICCVILDSAWGCRALTHPHCWACTLGAVHVRYYILKLLWLTHLIKHQKNLKKLSKLSILTIFDRLIFCLRTPFTTAIRYSIRRVRAMASSLKVYKLIDTLTNRHEYGTAVTG